MSTDISLPNSISFETLDPPPSMDDFIETIDSNYDVSYVVKADAPDKIAKLFLTTQDKQKLMMEFDARARIGIKGFNLRFNAENLLYVGTLCPKSDDGRHIWQSKLQSGKFHLKSCHLCGRHESNVPL